MKKKLLSATLIGGILLSPIHTLALSKNEMVYSNLDYNGTPYNISVSNHLSYKDETELQDETDLKNILNLNGKETFTLTNNQLRWQTAGKDIFYKGTTEKELPITTKVTYYLDGEEKELKDILGRKGNIQIVYQFSNTVSNTVHVNGKQETLYTPFLVSVGTIINSNCRNIEVTNGKVVNTGNRSMVIALASPGLYDSIGLESLKSFDQITISFDTDKFELNNAYIISTPKLIEENDLQIFQQMDQLYGQMITLQDSINQIEKGSKDLVIGAEQINLGTNQIHTNLETVIHAVEQLKSGSIDLETALEQMITALEQVKQQFSNSNNTSSLEQLTYLKKQNETTIQALIQQAGHSFEELQTMYGTYQLKNYTGDDASLLTIKSTCELITLLKANSTAISNTITTMESLSSQVTTLLDTLSASLEKLKIGTNQITGGLENLQNGIHALYQGSTTLQSGTEALSQGATTLHTGISTLNQQGIQQLTRYATIAHSYSNKADALIQLSKNYQGFASTNSNNTTFVSMIKSAKAK